MSINRAPFNALIDDNGTNTVGSVWNKAAIKDVILDPVDAALAVDWVDIPYNAANFSASSGVWAVAASDVRTYRYLVVGRAMLVSFYLSGTSVSGTPVELHLAIPNPPPAKSVLSAGLIYYDGTQWGTGYLSVTAGLTYIGLGKEPSGVQLWPNTTDTTHLSGQMWVPLP